MFKKFAGLFLAAAVMCSAAAVSASAAESDDDSAVAATEQSGEVSATEESDEVSAEASEETGAQEIYFDVKKSGWNNVKTVFCHVWRADGTGDWPGWQTKKERCTYDSSTGIATYNLSKTGNEIKSSDGNLYCVIFSTNTGTQTYNTIMSGSCIGDTMYCTGEEIENPEDSEKKAAVAAWENNPDCGPEIKITSTGNVVGTAYPEGTTNTTLLATYLIAYYNDDAKVETSVVQNLIDTLKLNVDDVQTAVDDKLAATNNTDADTISAATKKILAKCTSASDASSSGSSSTSSGTKSSSSGSGSSSSTSSGSSSSTSSGSSSSSSSSTGSVKSGVESTIVFVAAGVMISAAGLMFLARKRRQG